MSVLTSTRARASATSGFGQVAAAGVLWGTGGIAVHLVRDHADLSAVVITGYRVAIGALVLLVLLSASRRTHDLAALLRRRPGLVAVVALSTLAYQLLYYLAVVQAGVSVATVVTLGLAPLLLTAHEARARRRLPSGVQLATLAAALTGLVLVARETDPAATADSPTLGLLSAVGSAAAYALATRRGVELMAATDEPLAVATVTTSVGAVVMVPTLVILAATGAQVDTTEPAALGLLAYLGVATMALATCLVFAGLRSVSGSAATLATLLEPIAAATLAVALLGERLGGLGWLGVGLVVFALAGLATRRSP